jgi:hypothetical protein
VSALRAVTTLLVVAGLAGNLVRVPLFTAANREAPLIPLDVALALFLLVATVEVLRRRRLALDAPALWGGAFVLIAATSLATAGTRLGLTTPELLASGAYLARWVAYFLVFALGSALFAPADATPVATAIRRTIVAFAAFGIVQAIFLPNFALIVHPGSRPIIDWDPQRNRLVSTMLDPNYAGVLIVVGALLWGTRVLAGAAVRWWEGVILGAALILTLSRGAILAAVCAAAAITVAHGVSRRALRIGIVAGLVFLAASPFVLNFALEFNKLSIDASALTRLVLWQRNFVLIADHPVLGIGFNTTGFVSAHYGWPTVAASRFGLDGGLLFIAALTGLVGAVAFTGCLVAIVRSARRSWRDALASPDERAVALAALGSVVAVMVHSLFATTVTLPLVLAPCWLIWSLPRVYRRARAVA